MLTDVNRHCGDNFAIYTNIKPICCTLQNNTIDMSVIPIYVETIHMQKLHKYFLKVKKNVRKKGTLEETGRQGGEKSLILGWDFMEVY